MKKPARWRRWLAEQMHWKADRLDPYGSTRITHWTFTFEKNIGVVFREDGRGCQLAYLGEDEYKKAHDEADTDWE